MTDQIPWNTPSQPDTEEHDFSQVSEQIPTPEHSAPSRSMALSLRHLVKEYRDKVAVDGINLDIPRGSFFGLVGRNGAGKTTTLNMATGLLRPTAGTAHIGTINIWEDPIAAKKQVGVLPDGVRLFDKLTGEQLLYYAGMLHGLDRQTVKERSADLLNVLEMGDAGGRRVCDYSAGMTKKIGLGCALIHAPSLLILDEPFEAVDPVSASNIQDILRGYIQSGGTIVLSSHVMDLVGRLCDHVAVMNEGRIVASGTLDDVCAGKTLEERFIELVGGRVVSEGISWLKSSSN